MEWRGRLLDGSALLCLGMRQSACTQESRVTFVSELFQLRLLCSLLQLFLISQSIPPPLSQPATQNGTPHHHHRYPPSVTTTTLHCDTHSHLLSHVKIATRTTTGVYTRLSVHTGFRVIYEGQEEMKHEGLHCV